MRGARGLPPPSVSAAGKTGRPHYFSISIGPVLSICRAARIEGSCRGRTKIFQTLTQRFSSKTCARRCRRAPLALLLIGCKPGSLKKINCNQKNIQKHTTFHCGDDRPSATSSLCFQQKDLHSRSGCKTVRKEVNNISNNIGTESIKGKSFELEPVRS